MTDKLKNILDNIRAEDTLKIRTASFLHKEILKREKTRRRSVFLRISASLAFVLPVVLIGILYFTPSVYVDIDVNPSVEIILNRFDRVIETYAYNPDGEKILKGMDIKHKKYNDAIGTLIDAIVDRGYGEEDGLVSVTLQGTAGEKEDAMLSSIETCVLEHHRTAQVEVFTVGQPIRDAAYSLNLSPAKYLAIQELITADPTATVESCRNHSIGEIKRLTNNNSMNHHRNSQPDEEIIPDTTQSPGNRNHHGGHGNRMKMN